MTRLHLTGDAATLRAALARLMARPCPPAPHVRLQLLDYQLMALFHLASQFDADGSRILEIGTGHGGSGFMLAQAAPRAQVLSLTTSGAEVASATRFWRASGLANVRAVRAASWDYLEADGASYDMVFVDGDHNRLARDLPWFNRLRVGGLLLCHDYSPQDSRSPSAIVYELLNDASARLGRQFDVLLVDDGRVGMAGFYRRSATEIL